jgi:hypothetical protein
MRKVLLIGALVLSVVALTAAVPSSSMAWYGGGCGCGYGGYGGYGWGSTAGYGGYGWGYSGYPMYYGGGYGGRGWYGGRGYGRGWRWY